VHHQLPVSSPLSPLSVSPVPAMPRPPPTPGMTTNLLGPSSVHVPGAPLTYPRLPYVFRSSLTFPTPLPRPFLPSSRVFPSLPFRLIILVLLVHPCTSTFLSTVSRALPSRERERERERGGGRKRERTFVPTLVIRARSRRIRCSHCSLFAPFAGIRIVRYSRHVSSFVTCTRTRAHTRTRTRTRCSLSALIVIMSSNVARCATSYLGCH